MVSKPRISARYKPGKGDKGNTRVRGRKDAKKDCPDIRLYLAGEQLQIELSELLLYHETNTPLRTVEAVSLARRLEGATNDLMAFFCCEGEDYFLNDRLEEEVKSRIEEWQPQYGESREFQHFSQHPNLHYLNKIRKAVRALEKEYQVWYNSEWMDRLYKRWRFLQRLVNSNPMWLAKTLSRRRFPAKEKEELQKRVAEIERYARFLNRLSTLFWLAIQVEREALNLPPKYWTKEC